MAQGGIARVEVPADARRDTLAVREGLPPSLWGENSEALFLTSSFVQPDAASGAARFANEEEAFIYSRFSNPPVTMFERMNTPRKPSSRTQRRDSATASSVLNGEIIPTPINRRGSCWQKSYSQLLYARASAAASGGAMCGSASVCKPRDG